MYNNVLENEYILYEIFEYLNSEDIIEFSKTSSVISSICLLSKPIRLMVNRKITDSWIIKQGWKEKALLVSIWLGKINITFELLRRQVDPSSYQNEAIISASEFGSLEIVNRLLEYPQVDPSVRSNSALLIAIQRERTSVVERLLQDARVDPNDRNGVCLIIASKNGYTDGVKLLLNDIRTVPLIRDGLAIKLARKYDQRDVLNLLYQDDRVRLALKKRNIC